MGSATNGDSGSAGRRWDGTKGERHGWLNRVWYRRIGRRSGRPGCRVEVGRPARNEAVLAHVAEVALVPYAPVGGMGAGGIAPQPMTLATRDDQEEAGARLLEQIAAEHGLRDAEVRVLSAFRPNDSPIGSTGRTPS